MNKIDVYKWIAVVCMINTTKIAYSQKALTLDSRISNDICECFGGNGFTTWNKQSSDLLETCSKSAAIKYEDDLELYFASLNDSSYKSGYEAGKLYFKRKIAPLLFTNCEAIKKIKDIN